MRSLKRLVLVSATEYASDRTGELASTIEGKEAKSNSSPFPDVFVWTTTLNVGSTFMVAAQTKTSGKGEPA